MGVIIRNGIEYSGAGMGGGSCDCDEIVYLTQAEYDALPDSKLTNGVEYRITDANAKEETASNLAYDNTKSGLAAVNVQTAIDEVNESLKGINTGNEITVDASLSTSSTNPVQNKVVTASINTINNNLNNKLSVGSQGRLANLLVGAEGQTALIYNESGDYLNFRYKDLNGNTGYTSIAGIMNKLNSFQNGVDTIYNGCKTYGSTPTASTPNAIVTSIGNIYTNRYNAGYNAGASSSIPAFSAVHTQSGANTVINLKKGIVVSVWGNSSKLSVMCITKNGTSVGLNYAKYVDGNTPVSSLAFNYTNVTANSITIVPPSGAYYDNYIYTIE